MNLLGKEDAWDNLMRINNPEVAAELLEIELANGRIYTERVELIMNQLAQREGITEALKATDQMEWVRRMNSIRTRVEEIVLSELVYC